MFIFCLFDFLTFLNFFLVGFAFSAVDLLTLRVTVYNEQIFEFNPNKKNSFVVYLECVYVYNVYISSV
jgi:hypothetical protein